MVALLHVLSNFAITPQSIERLSILTWGIATNERTLSCFSASAIAAL
jgi:hypothetical protein